MTTFFEDGIEFSTFFDVDGNEWVPNGRVDFDETKGQYILTARSSVRGHVLYETPFQVELGREESLCDPSIRYTPDIVCNACRAILQVCNDRFRSVLAEGGFLAQRITVAYGLRQLRQSALLGCHLCSLFESCTLVTIRHGQPSPHYKPGKGPDYDYVYFGLAASNDKAALYSLSIHHGSDRIESSGNSLRVYPLLSTDDSIQKPDEARLSPSLGQYTGDDATFALAKGWLHECRSQHQHSAGPRPNQELAIIRLLHLHRKNTEVAARLVNYADDVEYLALSHCWGDQHHVPKLLRATEATMKKGINLSGFPRTFLDAMEITIRLGYKYLWVDSLCIMQDVEEDWRQQSSVMSLVYQISDLTIAALGSSDSRGGCFTTKRNPLILHPLSVNALGLQVEPNDKSHYIELELKASGPLASPLHTRAWVVQERLSAPRTLYYGSLGIYWECKKKIQSESHVRESSRYRDSIGKSLRDALLVTAGKQTAPLKKVGWEEAQYSFQDYWYKFLELYTPCFLTYPTDKLMAIRSIIRDIENSGCKPNLLGLWTQNLAAELIWHVGRHNGVLTRYKDAYEVWSRLENGLPSWTWASVYGRIEYPPATGMIEWEPDIDQSEADRKILKIRTYRRSVELKENDEISLLQSDTTYSGWGGDFDDEYVWRWDVEPHPEGLLWIILIQRTVISVQPRLRLGHCLLIRRAHGDDYERVGSVQVRYGPERDNPFNTNGQSEMEVIRLV